MTQAVRAGRMQDGAGIHVHHDGGVGRLVAGSGLLVVMCTALAALAGVGRIGRHGDNGQQGGQREHAPSEPARGSATRTQHDLPRPSIP